MTWSKCVIGALDDVKSTKLECVDASAAVPENFLDMFLEQNSNGKTKKQILDLINDNKMERLHEKLSHSTDAVDQVGAQKIEYYFKLPTLRVFSFIRRALGRTWYDRE